MMPDSPIQTILDKKRPEQAEYFVNLFEYCNLRCVFCWQDHDDKTGMNTVVSKAVDINRLIAQSDKHEHVVNLMGGELFADTVPASLLDDYYVLALRIHNYSKDNGKHVAFNFVTNLVFEQHARIKGLLARLRERGIAVDLTTSWDAVGRFTRATEQAFFKNLARFRDDVRIVSLVMTRQCINWFLNPNTDKAVFNSLYATLPVYFDTYSPEHRADTLAPTASEMQQMYLYLLEHYPDANPVAEWATRKSISLNCRASNIVGPQGYQGKCGALVPKAVHDDMAVPVQVLDNANIETSFVEKNQCLSCPYFEHCGLGCFLLHNIKNHNDLDECLYKEIHRVIGART